MLKYYTYRIEYRLCLIVTFYWTCNVSFQIHRSKIVIQKIVMIPLVVHCCIREKWWGSDYPPLNKSLFWEKSKEQTYFLLVLIIFYTLSSASSWDEILHHALCLSKYIFKTSPNIDCPIILLQNTSILEKRDHEQVDMVIFPVGPNHLLCYLKWKLTCILST